MKYITSMKGKERNIEIQSFICFHRHFYTKLLLASKPSYEIKWNKHDFQPN